MLALTMFDVDEHAFAALRAGATDFLLKDTRPAFARRCAWRPPPRADIAALAPLEREMLTLVAGGLSNVEITERATVKTYVGRLLAKLDARDRAQPVIVAYEAGLVRSRN
ncbi:MULTISPECIES: LuxR C-terminal-related transcriptional regulator [Amycolatopsis]|nr:LuxR C-terminal-related transcriptional regulator [Amycolatopsis sp. M39]